MKAKTKHTYILYMWNIKLKKYIIVSEFTTLEKLKEFYKLAKEGKFIPSYTRSSYVKKRILDESDLTKYYIKHVITNIKVERITEYVNETL